MLRTKNWMPPATGDPIIHPVFDVRLKIKKLVMNTCLSIDEYIPMCNVGVQNHVERARNSFAKSASEVMAMIYTVREQVGTFCYINTEDKNDTSMTIMYIV